MAGANTNRKTCHANHSAKQFYKTAKNKQRKRDKHAKLHPADKQAKTNWAASPLPTTKQ